MPERFIGGNTDGGGEIEGAQRFFIKPREGQSGLAKLIMERLRTPVPLIAEEEGIICLKGGRPEGGGGVC